jgi:multiple sugar transport system substrate-binding protein
LTAPLKLKGITWDHSRGYSPLAATAQRFHELHPEVRITWEIRSLKAFEHFPVEQLAADYDLIVLDHPCISRVAPSGNLLPLDEHLAPEFLTDQAEHSVGQSHPSYTHAGHHWALAIDAATPVAFWREDLFAHYGRTVPQTWEETIELARQGHVEIPAAPINSLMNFYSFCLAAGAELFESPDRVVPLEAGLSALAKLRELLMLCDPGCWGRDPIASHELVSSAANTRLAYCPLAYGYSNYARAGYADHLLTFGETPRLARTALRTVLGGAGLAVSALRKHRCEALSYAEFVASPPVQCALYPQSGGQPGYRAAWQDPENNRLSHDYFSRTLPALDRAYLRPRFPGYLHFQEQGASLVHAALRGMMPDRKALAKLGKLYREAQPQAGAAA